MSTFTLAISCCVNYFKRGLLGVGASLVAQSVKNLFAVQETWVRSLVWEDPLEKKMAAHSTLLGTWWAAVHGIAKSRVGLSN